MVSSGELYRTLDKTISTLEMELAAARAAQASSLNGSPVLIKPVGEKTEERPKAFIVIGINTAFSSRKRRYSLRETWMPQGAVAENLESNNSCVHCEFRTHILVSLVCLAGEKIHQIEKEKGIVIRFVIGHRYFTLRLELSLLLFIMCNGPLVNS